MVLVDGRRCMYESSVVLRHTHVLLLLQEVVAIHCRALLLLG